MYDITKACAPGEENPAAPDTASKNADCRSKCASSPQYANTKDAPRKLDMSMSTSVSLSRAPHTFILSSISLRRFHHHVAILVGHMFQLRPLPPDPFRIQLATFPLGTQFRRQPLRV